MKYVLVFLRNSSSIKKLQKLNLKRPQKTATQPTLTCPINQQRKHQNSVWNIFRVNNKEVIERRHWRRSGVFIVKFEQILHIVLVFLLLTLNKWMLAG